MIALYGEWVHSNLFFALAFLAAGAGIAGIGWWVLRGDSRNRVGIDDVASAEPITDPQVH